MTCRGAWLVAALSRYTSGRSSCSRMARIGKSARSVCTSRVTLATLIFPSCKRRIEGGLQHAPRQQAAFLPIGGELGAKELQHVVGRKRLDFLQRAPFHLLHQHAGRGLADAAPFPREPRLPQPSFRPDLQLHVHHVAAQWVIILVRMGSPRAMPAMIRILEVIQHVFLINLFFVAHTHLVASLYLAV